MGDCARQGRGGSQEPAAFAVVCARSSTPVPPEIWDTVLDHVRTPRDLATCARVCRGWNTRCTARLYRTLVFAHNRSAPSAVHFDALVRARSASLPHVREIEIVDDSMELDDRSLEFLITLAGALGALPADCNALERLTLSGGGGRCAWPALGPVLRNGLVRGVRRATGLELGALCPLPRSNAFLRAVHRVTALDLDWALALPDFAELVSYLRELTLLTVRAELAPDPRPLALPRFAAPCAVRAVAPAAASLLEWAALDPARIRGIDVASCAFSRYLCLCRAPSRAAPLIRSLALAMPPFDGSDAGAFRAACDGLRRFPALEHLVLHAQPATPLSKRSAAQFAAAWPDQGTALPPALRTLTLSLPVSHSLLDTALDGSAFRQIGDVVLQCDGAHDAAALRRLMPRLHARAKPRVLATTEVCDGLSIGR